MLKLIVMTGWLAGYSPADAHHFRYDNRLDLHGVGSVTLVDPYQDKVTRDIPGLAERRKQRIEKARIAARKRREAALRRAAAAGNIVLAGILDLKRQPQTAPIDGCQKVQKGLIMQGGFMLFTCEKLMPHIPISEHRPTFLRYRQSLLLDGWRQTPESDDTDIQFVRSDGFGCDAELTLRLWTDRSMNEPRRAASDRNAHRQIVFLTKFFGKACDRYYPIAEALAAKSR